MNTTKVTPKQLLARALWLAFQASSHMGLGLLHVETAKAMTEEKLFEGIFKQENKDGSVYIYTDYVAGRMMKTSFKLDSTGVISISPEKPRGDYQSWAAKYATATALLEAAHKSFE